MTNDLQQAYDRAIAHNALLREALGKVRNQNLCDMGYCYGCHVGLCPKVQFTTEAIMAQEALNATEADVTAWEKKLRQEVMLAVHPLQPEYEKLQQQLATVTAERDALRELQATVVCLYESRGGRNPYVEIALWERVHVELYRLKALAQKADA